MLSGLSVRIIFFRFIRRKSVSSIVTCSPAGLEPGMTCMILTELVCIAAGIVVSSTEEFVSGVLSSLAAAALYDILKTIASHLRNKYMNTRLSDG